MSIENIQIRSATESLIQHEDDIHDLFDLFMAARAHIKELEHDIRRLERTLARRNFDS